MKKTIIALTLATSLALTGTANATIESKSSGGSDTAVILLVLGLAAVLLGSSLGGKSKSARTTKSQDSQF